MSPGLQPPNEKRSLEIFQKTAIIKDNHIETVLLWKRNEPDLPHNQTLALNQYQVLAKKIQKKSDFAILYCKQIDGYISLGHARAYSRK